MKLMENYCGPNSTLVLLDGCGRTARMVWFSYNVPIAFQDGKGGLFVRQNDWSNTTGKHLNAIDSDKSKRISGKEFEVLYKAAFPE